MTETTEARPGSAADLSRRMDRIEGKYEDLAKQVAGLTSTVERVELNQQHAEELNKLRFGSLEQGMGTIAGKLDNFMARIEGMIDGTVQTTQTREAQERVRDYEEWRSQVDADRARLHLLGRLAVLLVSSNLLAIGAAIYAVTNG